MGDLEFWFIARITGLTAFAVLSLSVLSGEALRTSVLDFLATNRAIRRLHDFTTPLWLPLVFAHVIALVFDKTARISPVNVVVPFLTDYDAPLVSALAWSTAAGLAILGISRIIWERLPG